MMMHAPNPPATTPEDPGTPADSRLGTRLQSLDALRGLTIALMILVNTSGDGRHTYRLLRHSPWNGCTLADVVFPCFLFMVGISLVLSLGGKLRRGIPRRVLVRQALRRAVVLFAIGIAINGFPRFDLHTLRVFGVLQRIAICFFLATLNLPVAAPTHHCLGHRSHPAGLLDTPPLGSRAWLRLTRRERPLARPAWQPARMA